MDKISIIVPIYNVAPYLEKCLNSILAQTHSNIEVICVDDGSTDGSGEILERIREQDNRIIALHQENKGVATARNLALEHVTGTYIGFVDSDDWIELDMYEVLYHALIQNEVDVVTCGYYMEDGTYSKQVTNQRNVIEEKMPTSEFMEYIYNRDCYKGVSGYLWTRLFRAELFVKTKEQDEVRFQSEFEIGEDVAVIADCCVRSKTMMYISEPYYHYVQRPMSAMHDKQKLMEYKTSCEAYEYIISVFEKNNISPHIIRLVKRFYVYHASNRYRYALEVHNTVKAEEAKQMMKRYLKEYIVTNLRHPDRIWGILKLVYRKKY